MITIKTPSEFQLVYRKGRRFVTRHFVWFFLSANTGEQKRMGMTVTKEIGNAVRRNRIRRQIREAIRLNEPMIPYGDLVVKARMGSTKIENRDLRKDLNRGLLKLIEESKGCE